MRTHAVGGKPRPRHSFTFNQTMETTPRISHPYDSVQTLIAAPRPIARRQAAICPKWSISCDVIMKTIWSPRVGKYFRIPSSG